MLPAVLVVFGVENLLFVLLRGDVALPLLLTVTVLPTHPAVKVHLQSTKTCIPSAGVSVHPSHTVQVPGRLETIQTNGEAI